MPRKGPETDDEKEGFEDSPFGWARRWKRELDAAKKKLAGFHKRGKQAIKRFKDDREGEKGCARLNLYTADVITEKAVLYGKKPAVTATRRYGDAKDDVARVGGMMLERIMNADIEKSSDTFAQAFGMAVDDYLKPGLGKVRLRYVAKFEPVDEVPAQTDPMTGMEIAPAVPAHEKKTYECVEADYDHWEDQLWDASARVPHEKGWEATRNPMTRAAMVERFGPIGKLVPLNTKKKGQEEDPWSKADVWEIHSKDQKEIFWYVNGFEQILDRKPDPLELEGFWSSASIMANLSTDELVPVCDYYIARDLYQEVDDLTTRISLLKDAIKVCGFYDSTLGDLEDLMNEGTENRLIPHQNWALLSEKGGLSKSVDWFPLEQVVDALAQLVQQRNLTIELLHQVTGKADIMRGAATTAATATEQKIKAQFGSVRIQARQDLIAEFASQLMGIKAEIIARHFDVETIIHQSNILQTQDAQYAQAAAELIKSDPRGYRIEVKPETVNMTDMAQLKSERIEYAGGLSSTAQGMIPLVQMMGPAGVPFLLELLQGIGVGMKGASTLEGIFDTAIDSMKQQQAQAAQQPPPPDPKLMVQQAKTQGDVQKIQAATQAKLIETHAKTQGAIAEQSAQAHYNIQERAMDMRQNLIETINQPPASGP